MTNRADIVVTAPNDHVQLVVEVRGKRGSSTEWAAQLRQNIIMHGRIQSTSFFLIGTPDRFYLWKDSRADDTARHPDYEIESNIVLSSQVKNLGIPTAELSESSLEILIISWLHDLIDFRLSPANTRPEDRWLFESGLYEAVKDGSVVLEAVA